MCHKIIGFENCFEIARTLGCKKIGYINSIKNFSKIIWTDFIGNISIKNFHYNY